MSKGEPFKRNEMINIGIGVLILILIVVLVFGGVFGNDSSGVSVNEREDTREDTNVPAQRSNGGGTNTLASQFLAVADDDFVRGGREPDVFVIEYSDFQCPFCARVHGTLMDIVDESEGSVSWVYRHLPLSSIHPTATDAAAASICIGQHKGEEAFWTFTDDIFLNDTVSLSNRDSLIRDASRTSGVSEDQLNVCLADDKIRSQIDNNLQSARILGGSGTPFFVIYNPATGTYHPLSGALPKENFEQVIDLISS